MAKNSITDYSKTAASNTDIQSVDIAEGCLPSGINNAIREIMADLADMNDGTVTLTSPSFAAATITGNLTVDTNTLHVDSTNNRVGIGTSSPDASLHIEGSGVSALRFGNIGPSSNSAIRLSRDDITVTSGNPLGYLQFGGNDSTSNTDAAFAYVSGEASGTHGAGDNPTDLTFGTTADGSSTPAERMRIDSSGNVGIGTSLTASSSAVKTLFSNTSGGTYIQTNSGSNGGLVLGTDGGGAGVFFTYTGAVGSESYSERLRIDSSGNVGIGTSTPSALLNAVDASGSGTATQIASGTAHSQTRFAARTDGYNGIMSLYDSGGTEDVKLSAKSGQASYINNGGNVGIGTTSPDAPLEINKASEGEYLRIGGDNASNARSLRFTSSTSSTGGIGALHTIKANSVAGEIAFANGDGTFMYLQDGGNVGIGTSSPSGRMTIYGNGGVPLRWGNTSNLGALTYSGSDPIIQSTTGNTLFYQGSTERMRIESSGDVGIGTGSPASKLHVDGAIRYNGRLLPASTAADGTAAAPAIPVGYDWDNGFFRPSTNTIGFTTFGTERMRIDSSGSLLVGKTTTDVGTQGARLDNTGRGFFTRSASFCLQANRLSNDGEIMRFSKDGTTVGSINNDSANRLIVNSENTTGYLYVDGSPKFRWRTNDFIPHDDNTKDLGASSTRFDDIYATNTSIIGTSDANEKQQIASLTDSEITAAKALSKLFKTFKWNSAVESKGDNARTHTGHIAQDVQQAMTDAGLDAGDYAFFISNTWWETQTEVPAVEADEENGIEAADAYTRTDTYETAEEAPEGATERTRLGIRYPELLAFVGAATEQRLADIETRLTALEN